MQTIAHSLDGCLRLRVTEDGKQGVVEIRSNVFPGHWSWCVYRSQSIKHTRQLFESQCRFHLDPSLVYDPGV